MCHSVEKKQFDDTVFKIYTLQALGMLPFGQNRKCVSGVTLSIIEMQSIYHSRFLSEIYNPHFK